MHSPDTPELPKLLHWRICKNCGWEQPFQPYLAYDDDPVWDYDVEIDHLRQIVHWSNTKIRQLESAVDKLYDENDELYNQKKEAIAKQNQSISAMNSLLNNKIATINILLDKQGDLIDYINDLHDRLRDALITLPDENPLPTS